MLLEFNATNVWLTLAWTVGADVNPLPAFSTVTACITSFSIIGCRSNNEPCPPTKTISGSDTKLAPPFTTSR